MKGEDKAKRRRRKKKKKGKQNAAVYFGYFLTKKISCKTKNVSRCIYIYTDALFLLFFFDCHCWFSIAEIKVKEIMLTTIQNSCYRGNNFKPSLKLIIRLH